MNKAVSALCFALFSIMALGTAHAEDCPQGKQCVDVIVVTPNDDYDSGSSGNGGFWTGGTVPQGAGGPQVVSPEQIKALLFTVCKPKGPDGCSKWGTEMTTKQCTVLFTPLGVSAISMCRNEAQYEASFSCPNLTECP